MAAVSSRNVLTVGSRTFPGLDKSVPSSTMRPSGANGVSRPRSAGPRKSSTAPTGVAGRVRVAVRLRPRNAEELAGDADFGDCVELLPEMKRLKLRKNNWECDTYQFDEVLSDTSSQKRVYEVVAKPVVESVLEGYNGTVMAYGQTGTGKTYTLGRIDEEDSANRGIMVRAMEDIIADINPECDSVQVSYLQLYMETVQDLLAPEKDNIPIAEDPKTGDISILGATVVQITNQRSFVDLLLMGETNRIAANTKMNTESSRSHAILLVQVKKCKAETAQVQAENGNGIPRGQRAPTIRKSKLLIVDLAGSERVDKSGSEGLTLEEAKFINLSLTALGKCINALAENSPHVPTRDSKLTRLLRDSFGGTARTSLIITIGPSPKHRGETSSTILFGQRAMKVENMLKLKEEFDYKSLCRRLEADLDRLTADNERQIKALADVEEELEEKLEEAEACVIEAEEKLADTLKILSAEREAHEKERSEFLHKLEMQQNTAKSLQKQLEEQMKSVINEKENHVHSERTKYQKELAGVQSKHQKEMEEVMWKHQKELKEMSDKLEEEKFQRAKIDQMKELQYDNDRSKHQKDIVEIMQKYQKDIDDLQQKLQLERAQREGLEKDLANLQSDKERMAQKYYKEMDEVKQRLQFEKAQRERLEKNLLDIQSDRNKVPEPEDTHYADEILQLKGMLERECQVRKHIEQELQALQSQEKDKRTTNRAQGDEIVVLRQKLEEETKQREKLEDEVKFLKQQIAQESEIRRTDKGGSGRSSLGSESPLHLHRPNILRDTINGQRATIAKLFEQVGLQKILSLLKSDDADVRVHAVKVVANLAAEEANQEKIVEEGGLGSLLSLLQSNEDETIRRVAAGAVANLAMNETNQELIMGQGGISLLAKTADDAEDPQTLRMVAGAIANLCGNEKLQSKLREEGGIRGLLGMVRLRHTDVLAQVARGLANFAKCESRRVAVNGQRTAKSFLIEDGALPWIVANANNEAAPIRRHIELALCHLAQHEVNAKDLVAGGALWELVRVSRECSREDIRTLAQRTLNASPTFQAELRRLHVVA